MGKDRKPAAAPEASQPGQLARIGAPEKALAGWDRRHPLVAGIAGTDLLLAMIGLGVAATLVFCGPTTRCDRQPRADLLGWLRTL